VDGSCSPLTVPNVMTHQHGHRMVFFHVYVQSLAQFLSSVFLCIVSAPYVYCIFVLFNGPLWSDLNEEDDDDYPPCDTF